MDAVAVFVLLFILLACVLGIFHPAFDDNTLQRWGMALVGLGCIAEIYHLCDEGTQLTRGDFLVYVGVLTFVVGFIFKVWRFNVRKYTGPRRV